MHIVTSHKNTDFDALASAVAATLIHPGTAPVLPKALNPNVRAFLSLHKDLFPVLTPDQVDLDRVERLIVVDTASWGRLERMEPLRKRAGLEILIWDHHPGGGDIQADWACREAMGATITLMIRDLRPD